MVLFNVKRKTHDEKEDEIHVYKVYLKSPDGHTLTLKVSESEFEDYQTGDQIDIKWEKFQRALEDFNR